ncbi:MAG: hypothetical protein ABR551_06015 [Gemmatimonadales bacterium]
MPGFRRPLLLLLLLATPAAAQVGHPPERSPYRDIDLYAALAPQVSLVGGSGGFLGVVPNSGLLYGLRAEILANRPITIGIEFAYGQLERLIIQLDSTVSGPVRHGYGMVGANIFLNLTGGKTWRRLAPYVGGGTGVAFASHPPADTSGYKYGVKFYFAPTAGVRAFVTPDVYLRIEARSQFVSIGYPDSYRARILAGGPGKEWVTTGIYTVSLGFPFPRLF